MTFSPDKVPIIGGKVTVFSGKNQAASFETNAFGSIPQTDLPPWVSIGICMERLHGLQTPRKQPPYSGSGRGG